MLQSGPDSFFFPGKSPSIVKLFLFAIEPTNLVVWSKYMVGRASGSVHLPRPLNLAKICLRHRCCVGLTARHAQSCCGLAFRVARCRNIPFVKLLINYNTSAISTNVLISEAFHKHLAVNDDCTGAHTGQIFSLTQVFNKTVSVYQFRRTTEIKIVRLLSPASHWSPSGAFKVKGPCFVWKV